MVKKATSISIEEDFWEDWAVFVTRKYGSGRKISQAIEEAMREFMNRSDFEELDALVSKRGKGAVDLDEIGYDFEAAVVVMDDLESYISTHPEVGRIVRVRGEEILKETKQYNPTADTWILDANLLTLKKDKTVASRLCVGAGVVPIGFKFIDGDGYGIYEIRHNMVKRAFFAKRKDGCEDGIILRNRTFQVRENDVLEIKQVYGEGQLNCLFYFVKAGNIKSIIGDVFPWVQ